MQRTRPKNLNLFTIHFPVPAIISILHRISGAILFLLIPVILWGLEYSLTESGFDTLHAWFGTLYIKLFFWLLLVPLLFHLVAGLRHLLMDLQIGVTLKGGRTSAWLTLIISGIVILLAGIWLW